MDILQIIIYSLIGLFTGFLSGLFGIGGGSVRIPLLALSGMPLINAFAINIFSIPFGSATGAYIQRKNIRWDIVFWFTFGGVLGIIISSFLVGFLSDGFLVITFLFASLITVLGFYLQDLTPRVYSLLKPNKISLFTSAFFTNIIRGIRGGSGGSLFPPVLRSLHIKMHQAIATSLFVGLITALVALFFYIFRGDLLIFPGLIVAITSIVGSYFGSKLSLKTRGMWLKIGLASLEVLLAIVLIIDTFFI
jgi:uncharacterized membrane protein YfcA